MEEKINHLRKVALTGLASLVIMLVSHECKGLGSSQYVLPPKIETSIRQQTKEEFGHMEHILKAMALVSYVGIIASLFYGAVKQDSN